MWRWKMISMGIKTFVYVWINHKWLEGLDKKMERNSRVGEFGSTNVHIFHPWINMLKMLPWLYHYTSCWSTAQGTIQCSSNATARGRKIESSRSADLPDLPRRMPTLLSIWKWQMTEETINNLWGGERKPARVFSVKPARKMISLWQSSKQLHPEAEGGRALCKCFLHYPRQADQGGFEPLTPTHRTKIA